MAYTGQWRKKTVTQPRVRLVAPIDPQHSEPTDEQDPNYVDMTGGPDLPTDIVDGQYEQTNVPVAYLDQTPLDHENGIGDLPGYDRRTAQEVAGIAHQVDYGAVAAREYANPGKRDGRYSVTEVHGADLDGDSPETVGIRWDTGVGSPYDPDALRHRRIQRWRDRDLDMHWWGTEMRPLVLRNAKGSMVKPEVPYRTQNVSPYGSGEILYSDNWQEPQERRTPRAWDEGMVTDGTTQDQAAGGLFGLTQWGL